MKRAHIPLHQCFMPAILSCALIPGVSPPIRKFRSRGPEYPSLLESKNKPLSRQGIPCSAASRIPDTLARNTSPGAELIAGVTQNGEHFAWFCWLSHARPGIYARHSSPPKQRPPPRGPQIQARSALPVPRGMADTSRGLFGSVQFRVGAQAGPAFMAIGDYKKAPSPPTESRAERNTGASGNGRHFAWLSRLARLTRRYKLPTARCPAGVFKANLPKFAPSTKTTPE